MEPLKLIGYWANDTHPELPHPRDLVDLTWDDQERRMVSTYLAYGTIARACMGYSACRMCEKVDNGNLEYTDGVYLWPSGLVHYIDQHGIRLPAVLVEHAVSRLDEIEAAAVDQDWWMTTTHPPPR